MLRNQDGQRALNLTDCKYSLHLLFLIVHEQYVAIQMQICLYCPKINLPSPPQTVPAETFNKNSRKSLKNVLQHLTMLSACLSTTYCKDIDKTDLKQQLHRVTYFDGNLTSKIDYYKLEHEAKAKEFTCQATQRVVMRVYHD